MGDKRKRDSLLNLFLTLVGVTRLELATSRPPDAYSNQLSYTPIRILGGALFFKSDAKVDTYFETNKRFAKIFNRNVNFRAEKSKKEKEIHC